MRPALAVAGAVVVAAILALIRRDTSRTHPDREALMGLEDYRP